ncbi:MAG: tetratricopeptide repeat protein [Treponema sp.]|nr:tetratricopeptide repeat protein [Treponema sp.]
MNRNGLYLWLFIIFYHCPFTADAQSPPVLSALQNYQIGRDLEARNRMSEAEQYYSEAIRICQDEVARNAATRETYTVITWTLRRQNRHADTITWGERGLRLYQDEYRIVETMGESWFYLGEYNRSLSYMQRYTNAIPQGERSAVAFFFIGEIYRITEKYHHADIAYTTAVRLDPSTPLWWFRLGTVREASGERASAIEAFQRAVGLDPNYQNAIDGLVRLGAR